MKTNHSVVITTLLVSLLLLAVQQTFGQTNPKHFYKYDVIETTNSALDVFAAPSINDYGAVAFSGRKVAGGGSVFLSEIGQPNVDLMPNLSGNSNQFVSGRVQINNLKQVIQQTFISGTTPPQNVLRRINGVNDFTLIAYANGAGGFNDFSAIQPTSISINNFGEPVFVTAQGNNTTVLTTGIRPNFSTRQFTSTGDSLKPMISDAGCVVVRAGANATDPLRLYTPDLAGFETIASANDGFTAIGRSPAISNFCEVVVFYGDLNQTGAQTLGTNPGAGIFASITVSETQRKIIRLAGRLIEDTGAPGGNDDGYCDAGETCMAGELGFTQSGSPIYFNSFDTLNRVAVAHQSIGADGIEDDIFVVSFLGTPNVASDKPERPFSNQNGLWTLTTQIKNESGVLREKPLAAVPVVQIGDVINSRTVTGINVYDQIANVKIPNSQPLNSRVPIPSSESPGDHRLAFHVTTNNGNMIIRAERNVQTPVIFIPGVIGSTLVEDANGQQTERWLGLDLGLLNYSNLQRLSLEPSPSPPNIIATDVLRRILNFPGSGMVGQKNLIYEPLLKDTLAMKGGLREYQVEGKPERRTSAGCDLSQQFNSPTLFVFAYDWRKSNAENSSKLKSYIQCVQKFYPGVKVDVIAHSMGGLLARRYILDNPNDNSVQKLITIASPFLGAPLAIEVMETGRVRFFNNLLQSSIKLPQNLKPLVKDFKSVHELLPSEAYFTLGGKPFIEKTFDINNDGMTLEEYSYQQFSSFFNLRIPTNPYVNNQNFHTLAQDDWRNDTSGVEYYHLFGIQGVDKTAETIIAEPFAKEPLSITKKSLRFKVEVGRGDETVPRISAERCQNERCLSGLNLNFGDAERISFEGENKAEDRDFSHLGLVKSEAVRQKVLDILGLPNQFATANSQMNGGKSMRIISSKGENTVSQNPSVSRQGYYLQIGGVDRLKITDDEGNTNTPVGDVGFEVGVPDVNYFGGSEDESFHMLAMPAEEGEYTVKFRTGADSIDIELVKGIGNRSPNLAIRYIDLRLPANVECLLTLNPQGMEDLRYDSNGDGTFDTVVPAHVRVSGTAAQDVTAPTVTIAQEERLNGGGLISVNAADSQSGVKTIYYRFAGESSFRVYTAPFSNPSRLKKIVEAFADDNAGNRSSPVQRTISGRLN